ncbi:MAG TPA: tRNA dihydrouridine synthase DusB [Clostridia bacterium]|nr:MAG: tRNA-dihydrouridine synthase C [Firmicutes bacterium ADurb.Bin248]HOS18353.1 tRNA dihydrouridine synthase DusB [Clostridia bacterium]
MTNLPFFQSAGYVPALLAPMAGITDRSYRGICRALGADFSYTEMVSAKGMHYRNANTNALLETAPEEETFGVQLFGSEPEILAEAARALSDAHEARLAVIDINMGCPAHKIVRNGEGSALMRDEALAGRIIEALVKASRVPVSVKFRKGWDEAHVNAVSFARMAQSAGASLVTVHGRTREQMYEGRADRDIIAQVKRAVRIPVIGNGDVFSGGDALALVRETGCDGVMVARGARGNPFIFREIRAALDGTPYRPPAPAERIDMALSHARRHIRDKGPGAAAELRKHVAWYANGLRGASDLRRRANAVESAAELLELLENFKRGLLS